MKIKNAIPKINFFITKNSLGQYVTLLTFQSWLIKQFYNLGAGLQIVDINVKLKYFGENQSQQKYAAAEMCLPELSNPKFLE